MDIWERPLAITDVETTGLDPREHEIVEIGLLLVNQKTLQVLYEFEAKIKPTHPENISKIARDLNGYNEIDWQNAVDLKSAMEAYASKTKDAIFLAQNITFDWSFISEAFKITGVTDTMDYHRIDLPSIVWFRHSNLPGLARLNLDAMCEYFGILKEPMPHRAINGARNELAVLRRLFQKSR